MKYENHRKEDSSRVAVYDHHKDKEDGVCCKHDRYIKT